MESRGSLTVILSTMQGGKTTYVIRLIETLGYAFRNSSPTRQMLYVNHSLDDRAETVFSTHSSLLRSANLEDMGADAKKTSNLASVYRELLASSSRPKVVIIDEANFFTDLVEYVPKLVDELGLEVYVAGLNGDYQRRPFGQILNLIPHADDVKILRDTYCNGCSRKGIRTKAIFTRRISDVTGSQIEVGASNYEPVCRGCFLA